LTTVFIIAIISELILISIYFYFVGFTKFELYTSMVFGLLGGSLGVALNIGKDLIVESSNRLQMLRLILRPFIGTISAIVIYLLLQTKVLIVSPIADSGSVLVLLSILAGFSERFIVKALSNYIPSMINK
jgi:phosphate/sulfate permease